MSNSETFEEECGLAVANDILQFEFSGVSLL